MPFKHVEDYNASRARWRQTPRGAYSTAKSKAKQRGIAWEFTFESWMECWGDQFTQRGEGGDALCMARHGDTGPYSPDNVAIITQRENDRDRELYKQRPTEEV